MSKHTKGPWHWVSMGDWWELRGADGSTVCDDGSACGEYYREIEPHGHNAILIAAAPELYDELVQADTQMQMAYECVEAGRYDEALLHLGSMSRARCAAIAKAKGEQ